MKQNAYGRVFGSSIGTIGQKITYFRQVLGVNFKLEFSRNLHGPYSEPLKRAFVALQRQGMINGFIDDERLSYVTPRGCALADEFLSQSKKRTSANEVIDRLSKLVQRFEGPLGLKLLSSVHWLAQHENHNSIEKIIESSVLLTSMRSPARASSQQ